MSAYCVYILASRTRRLYVGCTGSLVRRLHDHRTSPHAHFTRRYNIDRLVHAEWTDNAYAAVSRERQLKGWTRARKIALIERDNPGWDDLRGSLLGGVPCGSRSDPSGAARPQDDSGGGTIV